jgi:hypothetical protein
MSEEEKDTQPTENGVQEAPEVTGEAPQPETPVETPDEKVDAPDASEATEEPVLETPADEDSAKRLGVKESAENADLMSMEKEAAESAEDGEELEAAPPSFFVDTEKKHRVETDILCNMRNGDVLSVSRTGIGIDYGDFKYLNHLEEWFDFTLPTYEDMSTYRQRCGVYRKEAQQVLIDRLQLRNFLLVWHLKDWSLRTPNGEPVKLEHEENGALSDESLQMVYKTHTTILDVVLTIFEKDILLT